MSDQESAPQPEHAGTDDSGQLVIDIEDAGGRELRPVDERPPDDEVAEMDQERERRLDPDNRPAGSEVDNTERDFEPETGRFTDGES